jgi:hypothetical protein
MCQGRVTGEFARGQLDQEAIMTCATQFLSVEGDIAEKVEAVAEGINQ